MNALRLVFTGPFGAGHLGSEAILLAQVRGFSLRRPGLHVTVASFDPAGHRALGLDVCDARDRNAVGKAITEADLLVVGGGALWRDDEGWNPGDLFAPEPPALAFYARGPLAAAAAGVPYVLFANGVGPLRSRAAQRAVASLASLASAVSVRNSSSAELLRAGGYAGPLVVAADPAFAIVPVVESLPPRRRAIRIGIVPRIWRRSLDASGLLQVVGHGIGSVARARQAEVLLLRFKRSVGADDEDDDMAIYRVAESLLLERDAVHIVTPATPEVAAGWLGSCDAVITMRLHGAILAAVAGVPSVSVVVGPKMEANARRLGLSELAVPLESCSRSLIQRALENALDGGEPLRASVEAGVDAARQLLNAAFDHALRCVEEPPVTAGRPFRNAFARTIARPCLVLRLPPGIEQARQTARAASELPSSMIVAVGAADECAALQADASVSGIALAPTADGSFHDVLRVAADALAEQAPAAVDVVVIDARRFSPASVVTALDQAYASNAEAAIIAARALCDSDAAPSGAICPDLGAARIRRTLWNEATPHLVGLETAAGCGAEFARRARQQMRSVVSVSLSPTTAEDPAAIERDLLRAPSFAPLGNRYHLPRRAVPVSAAIAEWAAGREVVVFPPTGGWTVPLAQRPHHMARALAGAGHAVIYSVEHAPADEGAPKEVAPGVLAVADAFSSLSFLDDPIVILYAYNVECAAYFRRARSVYESIDDLSVFAGDHDLLLRLHRLAIERADVVTATAATLWREAAAMRPDALYLPNAVHVADFDPRRAPEVPLPEADVTWFETDDRPVVIYWGAVAPWFDDRLVVDVARRRPDLRFAVLGPGDARDLDALQAVAPVNLRYFGPRPYPALATYARRAAAALLPFSPGVITRAMSPLQLFEYLAARLPVVSTPLPESGALDRVLLAGDGPSFSAALDQALALRRDPEFVSWADAVASRHDWSARAAAIRAALRLPGALAPAPLRVPADLEGTAYHLSVAAPLERESQAELLSLQLARREETLQAQLARVLEKEQRLGELAEQLTRTAETVRGLTEREQSLRRELARAHTEVQTMKDSKFWRLAKILAVVRYYLRALVVRLRHPMQGFQRPPAIGRIVAEVKEDLARLTPVPIKRAVRAAWRRGSRRPAGVRQASRPRPMTLRRVEEAEPSDWYESLRIRPGLQDEDLPTILGARPPGAALRADVICFSIIDWEFRYQRPQQIMSQFAAHGHRVFYLSASRFAPSGSASRVAVRPIKENVYEVSLAAERAPQVYGEVIDGENQAALLASLDELRRTFHIDEALAYVMIASWDRVALEARRRWGWRTVYDCMDEWENFPGIKPALLAAEVRLVEKCDLLVVTAQRLYDKWRTYDRPMVLARNGVDYDFYAEHCRPNVVLSEVRHPMVGYYGAIAEWFDVELMTDLARQRPEYTFVLLGGVFDVDVSGLRALPNVRLLGQQPYERMPQYLYHFDACIIPFKLNPITEATDPVKLYEYLSGGKPVVSVALPELVPYRDYLYIANDNDDFVAMLDAAVAEDDREMVARRREVARRHTWEDRYRIIDTGLAGAVSRASIVMVTYNHLAVTKLCLESLVRNTDHPNYEVIIVDNDSIDGTQAYLRYMTSRYPHVRIVLNSTNHGFARANNQGIALSTGDDLVLLNNDTIVPPGWLSRLLRHLRAPTVGLVGPLTNAIGNEAQIDVPYQTWAEMEAFAEEYTWAHDGQVADIHMLAMFCVALRRETYDKIGPLDEQFGIGMFEDDDYTLRVKQRGYRVICAADVFVHHFGQATFKDLIQRGDYKALFEANQRRYEAKWNTRWAPHQHAPLRFELLTAPLHDDIIIT
jgi:GT2 family glycosyltransferase/polysaccharide pyruvyl transferase WcaK-like protein